MVFFIILINYQLIYCNFENENEIINNQNNQELEDILNQDSIIDEDYNKNPNNYFDFNNVNKDSLNLNFNDKSNIYKSPTKAIYYSIIPGMGQYYVESYTKSILFFASATTLSGLIFYYNSNFIKDRDNLYLLTNPNLNNNIQNNDGTRTNERHIGIGNYAVNFNEFTFLRNSRENNRDNRDRMGFFLGVLYIISTIDAYTDAHLFNFNVNDKLSYNIIPNMNNNFSINICYKF